MECASSYAAVLRRDLKPGSAVDARVVREKALHGLEHVTERWSAGRVVEVDVWRQPAVEERHLLVEADDAFPPAVLVMWAYGEHGRVSLLLNTQKEP